MLSSTSLISAFIGKNIMKRLLIAIFCTITLFIGLYGSFSLYKHILNKNPKVSLLVVTYNQKDYIEECLASLLEQDIDKEIIVMDDHSDDGTWEILLDFKEKHPEIKLYRNEKNLGTVMNRYNSLLHATGEYVFFIDGDDKIISQSVPGLYDIAAKNDADILEFGMISESGKKITRETLKIEKSDMLSYYQDRKIANFLTNKLVHKRVYSKVLPLINTELKQPNYSDAVYYLYHFMMNADNLVQAEPIAYFYYDRRGITFNTPYIKRLEQYCDFYITKNELNRVYGHIDALETTFKVVQNQAIDAYMHIPSDLQEQYKSELYKIMTPEQAEEKIAEYVEDK